MDSLNETKKLFVLAIALTISLCLPVMFSIGLLIGYIGTSWYCKKYVLAEKVDLIIFNYKDWEIHVHHWISGILILFALYLLGALSDISLFWVGALIGMIIHDLYTDDVWYKVISKIEK